MTPIEYVEFDLQETRKRLTELREFATREDSGHGLCSIGSQISFQQGKLEALNVALHHLQNPEKENSKWKLN